MDARYEKLKGMIDAGRSNFDQAIREIMHENEVRQDILAKPSNLAFKVSNNMVTPEVKFSNGRTETMQFTGHSYSQFLDRAAVPARFAERVMGLGENALLEDILHKMAGHTMADGVLVRHVGDTIKGWLSPSYKRFDSGPIIESFVKAAVDRGFVPFRGRNTDFRYQIQFVVPEVVTVSANEYTVFGLSLVTGDYGSQALELNMLMVRLLCTNLHEGYDMFRKVHLGSRFNFNGEDAIRLSKQTIELDSKTVASAISDVTGQFGDHVRIMEQKIKAAYESEVKDPRPLYEFLKDKGVKKAVIESVKSVYESNLGVEVLPQERNKWRFSNALSYVAQGVQKQDEQIDLERLAMDVL